MACEDLARGALEPIRVGEEQIARAILPTVWQMFDEYGDRLNPSAEADRKGSLAQARRVLSCLTTHTAAGAGPVGDYVLVPREPTAIMLEYGELAQGEPASSRVIETYRAMLAAAPAGAGPVGEAVAWREQAEAFVRNYLLERDGACGFALPDDADPEGERKESAREIVAHLSTRPAEEPGEIDRLKRDLAREEASASEGGRRGLEREALARHMAAEYAQHEAGYDWELTDRVWQEGWRKAADRALAAIDAALILEAPAREGDPEDDPRYPALLADAKARGRNENLDGSPRRHAVAKEGE